jgi:hypothetical protein
MAWVNGSRMKPHLPLVQFHFFSMLNQDTIQINLSYFDSDYRTKHIVPDLAVYCTAFAEHMTPVLRAWASRNNMTEVRFQLRFNSYFIYNTEIVFTI